MASSVMVKKTPEPVGGCLPMLGYYFLHEQQSIYQTRGESRSTLWLHQHKQEIGPGVVWCQIVALQGSKENRSETDNGNVLWGARIIEANTKRTAVPLCHGCHEPVWRKACCYLFTIPRSAPNLMLGVWGAAAKNGEMEPPVTALKPFGAMKG